MVVYQNATSNVKQVTYVVGDTKKCTTVQPKSVLRVDSRLMFNLLKTETVDPKGEKK